MFTKVMPAIDLIHDKFMQKIELPDSEKFYLLSLEWCFRLQLIVEFFVFTTPQMIIMCTNNREAGWGGI